MIQTICLNKHIGTTKGKIGNCIKKIRQKTDYIKTPSYIPALVFEGKVEGAVIASGLNQNYLINFLKASKQFRNGFCNLQKPINTKCHDLSKTHFKTKHFISEYSSQRRKIKCIDGRVSIVSDQKKRALFEKQELKKIVLKTLIKSNPDVNRALYKRISQKDQRFVDVSQLRKKCTNIVYCDDNFSTVEKGRIQTFLGPGLVLDNYINKNINSANFSKIKNRCILSGHSTILGKFGLSRISFRRLAGLGLLPGIVKTINR